MRRSDPQNARQRAEAARIGTGRGLPRQATTDGDQFPDADRLGVDPLTLNLGPGTLGDDREPFATPFRVEPLQSQSHGAESGAARPVRQVDARRYQSSHSPPKLRTATTRPAIASPNPVDTAAPTATPRSPNLVRTASTGQARTAAMMVHHT